ncbi:MAG: RnfH family protein [Pseudomonadota bacterium]|nr:RnfH family protein [Pseudomonadota bacterium]
MQVSVAYVGALSNSWLELKVEEHCTVADAIAQSGVLQQFPEIDLKKNKVGIFGKFAKLNNPLQDGDRVEIYRPITRALDEDDDDDDD